MRTIFFILPFFIFNTGFSQTQLPPTIAVGIAARQGPLDFTNYNKPLPLGALIPMSPELGYVVDPKARLSIDVAMQVFKKNRMVLQISNFFTTAPTDYVGAVDKKRFKRDHFLDAYYPITGKQKKLIFNLGLGLGVMNCGTKDNYVLKFYDVNTNTTFIRSITQNYRFFSPRIILGVQKNRVMANMNINVTPDIAFENKLGSIAFEFRTTYTFRPFHKEHYKLAFKKIEAL